MILFFHRYRPKHFFPDFTRLGNDQTFFPYSVGTLQFKTYKGVITTVRN